MSGTLAAPTEGREKLLPIGRVAEQLGVSERTLRYYEEIGLVTPADHTPGHCRRYTEADVARLSHIRELQAVMGYSLEEIHAILAVEDRFEAIRAAYRQGQSPDEQARLLEEAMEMLESQRVRVRAKFERLAAILERIEAKAAHYREVHRQLSEAGR
jgi:DNA-binding transcriptional MerR regulator